MNGLKPANPPTTNGPGCALRMVVTLGPEIIEAWCSCGWATPRVADVGTAKQALDAHVKEQG